MEENRGASRRTSKPEHRENECLVVVSFRAVITEDKILLIGFTPEIRVKQKSKLNPVKRSILERFSLRLQEPSGP